MTPDITPFIEEKKIQERIEALGKEISKDYAGKELLCIGILKGSVVFYADLVRSITTPVAFDFIGASSYGNSAESSGIVRITKDLSESVEGKHVLVIEDIVDTGNTITYLLDYLKLKKPASIKLCSLLFKPARLQKKIHIDYLGFTIDDVFVVGYGLDFAEKFRNVPFLAKYIGPTS